MSDPEGGHPTVLWCVNHYAGLNRHPNVVKAVVDAVPTYGTSASIPDYRFSKRSGRVTQASRNNFRSFESPKILSVSASAVISTTDEPEFHRFAPDCIAVSVCVVSMIATMATLIGSGSESHKAIMCERRGSLGAELESMCDKLGTIEGTTPSCDSCKLL